MKSKRGEFTFYLPPKPEVYWFLVWTRERFLTSVGALTKKDLRKKAEHHLGMDWKEAEAKGVRAIKCKVTPI